MRNKDGAFFFGLEELLLYRGLKPTKENQATLTEQVVRQEEARGFRHPGPGAYLHRFFLDGLLLGTVDCIRDSLETARRNRGSTRPKRVSTGLTRG